MIKSMDTEIITIFKQVKNMKVIGLMDKRKELVNFILDTEIYITVLLEVIKKMEME